MGTTVGFYAFSHPKRKDYFQQNTEWFLALSPVGYLEHPPFIANWGPLKVTGLDTAD
jgi:hypothetical protein